MNEAVKQKTKKLIDDLKSISNLFGLGGTPGEYRIITETFLYKYLNDKFLYEMKKILPKLNDENFEKNLKELNKEEYEMAEYKLPPETAKFKPEYLISELYNKQNSNNKKFNEILDDTLINIANDNIDIFSVKTSGEEKIRLFESICNYVIDPMERERFAKAIINKLVEVNFEELFSEKYDFFSQIFEYLIKDYNKDFGQYAEYYTPHVIASIISKIMIEDGVKNVTVYDPSAGTGTLVLALAHEIGENKCSVYTQDISTKSNEFLRLNLILNNLTHSLNNTIMGDTLLNPKHTTDNGKKLRTFDYVISNPPFKMDFSTTREQLASDSYAQRFFAGVPTVPKKKKDSMEIYLLFIQHVINSLNEKGKGAIIVPTGFITAQSGIVSKVRKYMVENKIIKGVISMPSNIFATTGTNVSILFLDKTKETQNEKVILIDASNLGSKVKEDGKNQKTVLSEEEKEKIINTFRNKEEIEDFSKAVSYEEIKEKNNSLSAGQYFDIKIEYVDITKEEFDEKMKNYKESLKEMFEESVKLEREILESLEGLGIE